MRDIQIHPEVEDALRRNLPVVALETAVTTCGLPRTSLGRTSGILPIGWRENEPINLQVARAMEQAVRDRGAVPATIAVIDGDMRIGLSQQELTDLADNARAGKASTRDLAHALATKATAGTTVSATLVACTLPAQSGLPPIRVMATGGIGGVHRGWSALPDISTDLVELARTPVALVCSGAKSLLDLPATLEVLETLGIPLLGYRTDRIPQFISAGSDDLRVPLRLDDPGAIAALCRGHWTTLNQNSGIVIANPVPNEAAVDHADMERAIAEAQRRAEAQRIIGPRRTPFMLAHIAELTEGRSLDANIALLASNAALAAEVAAQIAA